MSENNFYNHFCALLRIKMCQPVIAEDWRQWPAKMNYFSTLIVSIPEGGNV